MVFSKVQIVHVVSEIVVLIAMSIHFSNKIGKKDGIFLVALDSNNLKIPAESGFTDTTEFIEDMLEKSTNRILLKLKA